MRQRKRDRDNELPSENPPQGGSTNENLERRRQAGEALLAAGADAINRALSSNSQSFLAANRQQGGQ